MYKIIRGLTPDEAENSKADRFCPEVARFLLQRGKMMVRLIDIDPNNWRLPLRVTAEQQAYVATTMGILARAYAYRKQRSRAFVIYDEDVPVGMGLYYDCPELESYEFSQLLVDARYQGRGYGKAAMGLVLDALKQDGQYDRVVLYTR